VLVMPARSKARATRLPNPLLQELPLRFLLGQRQRLLIRGTSLSGPAEPAVHIWTRGMRQVIICQFTMFQHRVDMRQAGLWTIAHCNGHGTIELCNWRRMNSYQSVVGETGDRRDVIRYSYRKMGNIPTVPDLFPVPDFFRFFECGPRRNIQRKSWPVR